MKSLIAAVCLIACLMLVACNSNTAKTITAASLSGVQVIVDNYLNEYAPTWSGRQSLDAEFSKAIAGVSSWKAGSAGSEVELALGAIVDGLDGIPLLNDETDQAIASAINFVDNMITIVQNESAANASDQTAVFYAWLNNDAAPSTTRAHLWKGKQIKTLNQFKSAWNKYAPKKAQVKASFLSKIGL
jgi:hypothetical protein